jgi:putative transposase
MKKSKFTDSQITAAIKSYEAGKDVSQICRELKINKATFYYWKKKFSGMDAELLRQFKEVQRENAELKRMYADLSLDHSILKKVIEKKI